MGEWSARSLFRCETGSKKIFVNLLKLPWVF